MHHRSSPLFPALLCCLALTVSFLRPLPVAGQNLVRNPGFDNCTACPDFLSQLRRADGWFTPTHGSPDYFHTCNPLSLAIGIPENQFGQAAPWAGNGYAGFYALYSNAPDPLAGHYREYLANRLLQPVLPGQTYHVRFRISLSDYSHAAVNRLGVLFCNDSLLSSGTEEIQRLPQLELRSAQFWNETKEWVEISGCITPDSAYRYLVIGNFRDADSTQLEMIHLTAFELFSYYYVDEVEVIPVSSPFIGQDTSFCGNGMLEASLVPPSFSVRWNTGAAGPQLVVSQPGWYYAEAVHGGCLLRSDSIYAGQHTLPMVVLPSDTLADLCQGSISLSPVTIAPHIHYSWSHDTDEPVTSIQQAGQYMITATDTNGCVATDTITVYDACHVPVYVPDAFTPNHDGLNDGFTVYSEALEDFRMYIYDRWGREIAWLDKDHPEWSGDHHPSGVYAWTLQARVHYENTIRELNREGHVMLMR